MSVVLRQQKYLFSAYITRQSLRHYKELVYLALLMADHILFHF